jgi:2-dehydro-3-deoxyphosphooctonate aldolase (KDO 8-P synthase)
MDLFKDKIKLTDTVELGGGKMVLMAGPCAAESYDICHEVAETVKEACDSMGIQYIFKSSFDKANRTSVTSYRGPGLDMGLDILNRIKNTFRVPVITDVHETYQVPELEEIVDVIQIPAFLCRQTDLLLAAGNTGKGVSIKRGQFMAPEDMQYAVTKVKSTGNQKVCITERGSTFGYHNLVVDMRALPIMRQYSPVIFDVTHSVQQPGGAGGSSGGQREFAPYLARAAAAAGVDGFFIETHPDPSKALSDGPNMIPLKELKEFLQILSEYFNLNSKFN